MTIRLGLLRTDRPLEVVAEAEARVITNELKRRLGPVTIDFRVEGTNIGSWQTIDTASWPTNIDAQLDVEALFGANLPPITAHFARTVEPMAADVRKRMLLHLGMIPAGSFTLDDELLHRLLALPLRPTDLWLVAISADQIEVSDVSVANLASPPGGATQAQLDQVFDEIAVGLEGLEVSSASFAQLRLEADGLQADIDQLQSAASRNEREAADLVDGLRAETRQLQERAERAELNNPVGSTPTLP